MKYVWIVWGNNGMDYEDQDDWIVAVYDNPEGARKCVERERNEHKEGNEFFFTNRFPVRSKRSKR